MPYPELEELYNTYRTDLYRYLCHLTHDPAEAEDLLSETFLRALRRLHTYRGDCAVKTWLFGIAHNVWLESLRKRRPTVSADDLLETYLTDDTLPDHTDTRLQWQRVQALLQQKDDRARRVVQLRAQGYSSRHRAPHSHLAKTTTCKGGLRPVKEAAEIKKIPCAVCRDLMPLVQDGVASPESEALVKAHLAACPACRALRQGADAPAVPELPAPDDGKILQKLRRRYSTHLLLLAFVGIAAGVALGYTGSANWVILFLPCVWAVLTCRDTGMGKPLLLFTLGLAVLDAIIKQTAYLESFSLSNFLWNLASGCILYAVLGGIGWLIGWLLHYAKESTHENKE